MSGCGRSVRGAEKRSSRRGVRHRPGCGRHADMELHFPILDDDKAYVGTWLYLPKRHIAEQILRSSLTLPIDQRESLACYQDHPDHLAVPRALIPRDVLEAQMPVVDLRPTTQGHTFQSDITLDALQPDRCVQRESVEAMVGAEGGILNLSCGKGKTVIALEIVARLQEKTLIVIKGDGVIGQWRAQIEDRLQMDTPIGHIQGPASTWRWKDCAITLASIDTLARHHARVKALMRRSFGVVIWDECHLLGARTFSRTASLFHGRRYGLTATVHREDDLESVFLWHLGPVIYQDLTQDVIPTVYLLPSPLQVDLSDRQVWYEVCDVRGELSHSKLTGYAANHPVELDFVEGHIREALNAGRRILAISMSRPQLEELHKRFPESGLITGATKGAEARRKALSEHQLTFGIAQLTREALDEAELDTLFILTEFKAQGMLQQSVGRAQRFLPERNKDCKVIVIQHDKVEGMRGRAWQMVRYFRSQGFQVVKAPER